MTDDEALAQAKELWGKCGSVERDGVLHLVGQVGTLRPVRGMGDSWEEAFDDAYAAERGYIYDIGSTDNPGIIRETRPKANVEQLDRVAQFQMMSAGITADDIEQWRREIDALAAGNLVPVMAMGNQVDMEEFYLWQIQIESRWYRLVRRYEHKHPGGARVPPEVFPFLMAGVDRIAVPVEALKLFGANNLDEPVRLATPEERKAIKDEVSEILSAEKQKGLHEMTKKTLEALSDKRTGEVMSDLVKYYVGDERRPKGSE